MSLITKEYTQFYKPWFSGTPQNAAFAAANLTISGNVADGETVTMGTEVYEFDTDGSVTAGNISVDVSVGGVGNVNAAAKLTTAINANSTIIDAFDILNNGVLSIQSKIVGTEGNDIEISTDVVNATFGAGVTKLSGGLYAIPSKTACYIVLSGVWYTADEGFDKYQVYGWKSFTPSLVS